MAPALPAANASGLIIVNVLLVIFSCFWMVKVNQAEPSPKKRFIDFKLQDCTFANQDERNQHCF
jgi:hypothetical protein